jgi:4a-hydroxytetrahydrobiopterin dehydratase
MYLSFVQECKEKLSNQNGFGVTVAAKVRVRMLTKSGFFGILNSLLSNYLNAAAGYEARGASPLMRERRIDHHYDAPRWPKVARAAASGTPPSHVAGSVKDTTRAQIRVECTDRAGQCISMTLKHASLCSFRKGHQNFSQKKRSTKAVGDLASRECVPCRGGVPPLQSDEIKPLLEELNGWTVEREHHLLKTYTFKDFREALEFVNRVGQLAEEQGHHPDICFGWGRAEISLWTHKIDGLTESDFILAAKIDAL